MANRVTRGSALNGSGMAHGAVPRWTKFLIALVLASASLAVLAPTPAYAAGTVHLVDPVTDNYKTWVDDRTPGHTDNRTSLLFSAITDGDRTYVVPQSVRDAYASPVGAPTQWDAAGGIPLALSVDGPTVARLRFDHDGGNTWSYFRLWPDGTFGPLMTINRAAFVADPHPPVAGTFTITSTDGAVLATRAMRYRYDAAIAALPESSAEWHGPLGRWAVGADTSAPTPLNWATGIAVSGTSTGPHASRIDVTAGEAATLYVAAVDLAGLAVPRVPESLSLTWSPAGAGRRQSAPSGAPWRPVTVVLPRRLLWAPAHGHLRVRLPLRHAAAGPHLRDHHGRRLRRPSPDVPARRRDPRHGWVLERHRRHQHQRRRPERAARRSLWARAGRSRCG